MAASLWIYAKLAGVFSLSLISMKFAAATEFVQGMIAIPVVGSLLGALFQIGRDVSEFERKKHLQLDQQIFTLGASSHMATVAFDKHVQFCEAYMSEVYETVSTLFTEGPTAKAPECAQKLFALKRTYAAWIPQSIAIRLEPFETALHRIGVLTHLYAEQDIDPAARSKAIDESYALFANLMGLSKLKQTDPEQKKELAQENVKEEIRSILGINEIVDVRNFIIKRSAEFAKAASK